MDHNRFGIYRNYFTLPVWIKYDIADTVSMNGVYFIKGSNLFDVVKDNIGYL